MNEIIKVDGLTKIIGKSEVVVNNVSFVVNEAEMVLLLGHNGAGKTTIFKMLLGLMHISKGSAYINNKKVPSKESREKVGFLPELLLHPSHLTVIEYINYYCKIAGMSISNETLETILKKVGMYEAKDKLLIKCSKGMRQRADIARLIALDCKILLLDEPFSGLDPSGQLMLKNILLSMKKEGRTILINTHSASNLEGIVDRVIVIKKGQIVSQGKLDELLETNKTQIKLLKPDNFDQKEMHINQFVNKFKPLSLEISGKTIDIVLENNQDINNFIYEAIKNDLKLHSCIPIKLSLDQYFVNTIGYTD